MTVADTSLGNLKRINPSEMQQIILNWMKKRGGEGTLYHACVELKKERHAISGRFSELKKAVLIRETGRRYKEPGGSSFTIYALVSEPVQTSLF